MPTRIMKSTTATRQRVCALVVMVWLVSACQTQRIPATPESSMTPQTQRMPATPEPSGTPTLVSQTKWDIESVRLGLIQDETAFVSNPPNYIAAFGLSTGTFVWRKDDLNVLPGASIAADVEHLYAVTSEGVLALKSTNGVVQWRTSLPTDGAYHELAAIEEEQIVIYGNIYPFVDTHVLYALDSQTGGVIWQVELPGSIDWHGQSADFQRHPAIAYDRGRIYLRIVRHVGGKSGVMFGILAIDAQNGTELWQFGFGVKQLPGEGPSFGADSLVFGEDLIYIPTYLGPLYTVNRSGMLRGMIDEWWTSLVRVDDLIVAEVLGKGIVAIDQASGTEIWTVSLGEGSSDVSRIVPLQSHLFLEISQANEIRIAVLELASGKRVETITPLNSPECSRTLALDVCGDQLCLITMNCIYQFSITF
jgi:outer membrane protein assembly factor BamB